MCIIVFVRYFRRPERTSPGDADLRKPRQAAKHARQAQLRALLYEHVPFLRRTPNESRPCNDDKSSFNKATLPPYDGETEALGIAG